MSERDDEIRRSRSQPFLVALAVIAIVTVALFRLPELYVAQLERGRPLDAGAADWAYRLLLVAAIAQAAYGGFVVLRVERIERAREAGRRESEMTSLELARAAAWNAVFMIVLTLVYGGAAFVMQRERGGFWAFVLIAVAQAAWYFREVGQIHRWLSFQPEPTRAPRPTVYCPPIARGLG